MGKNPSGVTRAGFFVVIHSVFYTDYAPSDMKNTLFCSTPRASSYPPGDGMTIGMLSQRLPNPFMVLFNPRSLPIG